MPAPIHPSATFKETLSTLPSIEGVDRVNLVDAQGTVVATIENQPGKQGSLAIYQYLKQQFGSLDAEASEAGLALFGEHVQDARSRPGAHPNVDRLIDIAEGGERLEIEVVTHQV